MRGSGKLQMGRQKQGGEGRRDDSLTWPCYIALKRARYANSALEATTLALGAAAAAGAACGMQQHMVAHNQEIFKIHFQERQDNNDDDKETQRQQKTTNESA